MSTVLLDEKALEAISKGMEILLVAFEAAMPRLEDAFKQHQSPQLAEALTILKKAGEAANTFWKWDK